MKTPLLRKWLLSTAIIAWVTLTAQAQYCAPGFGTGCGASDAINDFVLTGDTSSISDLATGCSPNDYRDMSATMSVTMDQGRTYVANISSSFSYESVEVYIDFNNDSIFSPGESVGGSNSVVSLGTNMNISIPNGAPLGIHRMRVVLSFDFMYPGISACPTVGAGYEYGEVHDYTAKIISSGTLLCAAPASLSAGGTTASATSIIWQPVAGAAGYEYAINLTSGAPATADTTTATTIQVTGLSASTVYYVNVRTRCNDSTFSGWTELEFATNGGNTCIAPVGLSTTAVANDSVDITWAAVAGTLGYEIDASDRWGYPTIGLAWTDTSVRFINLFPNTTHYMWVRHHCSSTDVSDWAVMTFKTANTYQPASGISGNIYFGDSNVGTADIYRVWLINYDSTANTLTAVDSLTTASSSYVFTNPPAGTYLVKAALLNGIGIPGLVTQVPTYHDSSLYWNTATLLRTDTSRGYLADIWMREGVVTAGPGFVGGNVSLGANKSTSSGVKGITIVLRDANGSLMKGAYTDAAGNFSFGNLPVGTYSVYPENLGYATTVATLNITTGQPSIQNINFNQDDANRNIKPQSTGIGHVNATNPVLFLTPNPANNVLSLSWSGVDNDMDVTLTILHNTGTAVFTRAISAGTTATSVDISALPEGVYFLQLKGSTGSVVNKFVIQH